MGAVVPKICLTYWTAGCGEPGDVTNNAGLETTRAGSSLIMEAVSRKEHLLPYFEACGMSLDHRQGGLCETGHEARGPS